MFGILKPALRHVSKSDHVEYQRHYCGLCGCLAEHFGLVHRMMLVNDVVTLQWLFEDQEARRQRFCRANCLRGGTLAPRTNRRSERERFSAALSVLLYFIKARDDRQDGNAVWPRLSGWVTDTHLRKARSDLDSLGCSVAELDASLAEQVRLEDQNESDFAKASEPTARCYAEVCQCLAKLGDGGCRADLAKEIGSRLGRLVYLIDAFCDRVADAGKSYNPLLCDGSRRLASVLPSRIKEFDVHIHKVFTELDALCVESDSRIRDRWAAIRLSLQTQIRRDPSSIAFNMVCCAPCGDGAVAIDTKEEDCGHICCCYGCMCAFCLAPCCCSR